jgi:outer membrane protein
MSYLRTLVALTLAGALVVPVMALDWSTALKLAQQNNPELRSASKQAEAAQWSLYRSYSSFLPQLSANASTGQSTSGTPAATANSSSYGLSVSQNIFSGLSNYYSAQSARASYDYYQAALQKAEADVFYQLRQSFVDLALADENVTLYKQIFERRKNNSDLIELRYDSGREDKGALLRTQADQADAAASVTAAERAQALAGLKLSQLISAEAAKAEGDLTANRVAAPDYGKLLAAAPANTMNLKQLERSEIALRQTIGEFLPSVSLSGSYRKSGTDWPPTSASNSWSLSLSYSLFPGGANIADRVIYAAEYDKAKQDFQNASNELRYSLQSAYQTLLDALEAEKTAKLSLDAASLRAEIARTKYINGLVSYDEWDRIENDYISAQRNLLSRKKSALYAEAAWFNSYGGYVK